MNKIIISGNLVRKPELEITQSGINKTRFSLAVKGRAKNENGEFATDFFNCVAWRVQAETLSKFCDKGDRIAVSGYMASRKYEQNGIERTIWEVNVEEFEFLTTKAEKSQTLEPIDIKQEELPF